MNLSNDSEGNPSKRTASWGVKPTTTTVICGLTFCGFDGCLLTVPATCLCTPGTDLFGHVICAATLR